MSTEQLHESATNQEEDSRYGAAPLMREACESGGGLSLASYLAACKGSPCR